MTPTGDAITESGGHALNDLEAALAAFEGSFRERSKSAIAAREQGGFGRLGPGMGLLWHTREEVVGRANREELEPPFRRHSRRRGVPEILQRLHIRGGADPTHHERLRVVLW